MKTRFTRPGLLFILLTMLAIACKKNDDTPTLRQKNLNLIMNKNWVPVFYGYDFNDDGVHDRSIMGGENALADCQMDDHYVFMTDSTFDILPNQVTNGCGTGGGPFSWGLGANGIDFDYPPYAGEVVTLTDSTFQFYILNEESEKLYFEFERFKE